MGCYAIILTVFLTVNLAHSQESELELDVEAYSHENLASPSPQTDTENIAEETFTGLDNHFDPEGFRVNFSEELLSCIVDHIPSSEQCGNLDTDPPFCDTEILALDEDDVDAGCGHLGDARGALQQLQLLTAADQPESFADRIRRIFDSPAVALFPGQGYDGGTNQNPNSATAGGGGRNAFRHILASTQFTPFGMNLREKQRNNASRIDVHNNNLAKGIRGTFLERTMAILRKIKNGEHQWQTGGRDGAIRNGTTDARTRVRATYLLNNPNVVRDIINQHFPNNQFPR